jgi:NET1-associated nuclear protein 1 (U3 small nucleolar RNA-associated protein 17)
LGASSFSLVGITNNYSVVLFGDDITAPTAEGSRANAIVGGAAVGQRQTLFQDIFGASAFSNTSSVPNVGSNSVSRPSDLPWSGNDTTGLFGAPAYLMPPIETLFAPLMDTLLKSRPRHNEKHIAGGSDQQGEDVEMAAQSDDEPVIIGEQRVRHVDQKEMDLFVELFLQTKGWFLVLS